MSFAVAGSLLGCEVPAPVPDDFVDRLYAAVDELCARGPVVLAVDDAHHAV